MARTIAGELTLPDGTPLANAVIHLTAKRTEATRILEDVSASFETSSGGAYSQDVESGYYAVSVSYAAVPGTQPRRWHLGDVWVEDGDPISLTALLALNNSAADPTDSALRQLLADAQAARDEAQAAAQEAEQYRDETASMLDSKIDESEKGEPGGVATLDSGGRVPAGQLPSYVDDVEEYADYDSLPRPGETGKIYITTDENRQYRWGGSGYIELVASPGTTDNVPEGSSNLYHTAARVRSVVLSGISFASSAAITASDTILSAFGKIQAKLNTLKGMAFLDKASQAQAEAGTSDSVGMTPLRDRQALGQVGMGLVVGQNPPEVADVDGAKTSGVFRLPFTATGDHPFPNISCSLTVMRVGPAHVNQLAMRGGNDDSPENTRIKFRRFNGADWTPWAEVWSNVNLPQSSIDNWNTAYGWGNHADAGYLTSVSWGDVEGKPAVIAAGATAEEARAAIGFDSVSPATPVNGGLLVNNQKTGTGLERVLTESDLGGAGDIKSGQITDATQIGRAVLTAEDAASARAAIGLQPEITGSATFVHSSNEISLVGIVPALELEIGDVIQVSGSASNNNLYTVEIINNDNSIVVNYEHRDGAGPLSLADETANVTIKRIAKWYSAPLGLGQMWQSVTSQRAAGVIYTNTTGRTIFVEAGTDLSQTGGNLALFVDDVNISHSTIGGIDNRITVSGIVPPGSIYRIERFSGKEIGWWRELR